MANKNIKEVHQLKEAMGSSFTMLDDQDQEYEFNLLLELIADGQHYAYFQSPDSEEGDIEVLKVTSTNGEFDLLNIDSDEEWETAAELFDEWTYKLED